MGADEGKNRRDSGPIWGFPSGEHHIRVIPRISSWDVPVDPVLFLTALGSFIINREALRCLDDSAVPKLRYLAVGIA